jgi:hypothetical protein
MDFPFRFFVMCSSYGSYVLAIWIVVDGGPPNYQRGLQHGQNVGARFTCNYYGCTKRGGGATQFKQHLVACGSNVKHCGSIPLDARDYFRHDLDRTAQNRKVRQQQQLLREEVAAERNVVHNIDSDNDRKLQRAIHLSREEAQYAQRVRQQGRQYEHGGGSSKQ